MLTPLPILRAQFSFCLLDKRRRITSRSIYCAVHGLVCNFISGSLSTKCALLIHFAE